jgi:hypothetical protein
MIKKASFIEYEDTIIIIRISVKVDLKFKVKYELD